MMAEHAPGKTCDTETKKKACEAYMKAKLDPHLEKVCPRNNGWGECAMNYWYGAVDICNEWCKASY